MTKDMDGVLVFVGLYIAVLQSGLESSFTVFSQAGLFSAVLTSFLVNSLQNLQPDPAQQVVYYQQQSVAMLSQISQQIASIAPHVSIPSTPPSPYPTFHPSISDIRVNAYWLISLICSLSAALFATLVQRWVRSYMQIFQQYDHPLKRARFRQFFFEGARSVRTTAAAVPPLIRISLVLFFFGLSDSMFSNNRTIGVITVALVSWCGLFFLYGLFAPLFNLQSPYKSLFSWPIFFFMQKFKRPYFGNRSLGNRSMSIGTYQEWLVMEETDERKARDVRAIRWLVDTAAVNADTEPLLLAIPGSFNSEWEQAVWSEVSQARDTLEPLAGPSPTGSQVSIMRHAPRPLEGTTVDTISRSVRYLLETCNNHNYFENEEARRRRIRACIEAAVPLICRIGFQLEWFGDIVGLVSEIGHIEQINESPTTTSDPSFIKSWACLSLMATPQILNNNQVRVLASLAVGAFQSGFGRADEAAQSNARRIDSYLKTASEHLDTLRQAFGPEDRKRTGEQIEEIIQAHKTHISDLERIRIEAGDLEDVDWRVSLLQDAMDEAGHRLMRQLPGVSFCELKRTGPSISEVFNFPFEGATFSAPQLIFPGRQVQALTTLCLNLREILNGGSSEGDNVVLESLKVLDKIPTPLHRSDNLMTRQLWHLQDLRDGSGLGFSLELFFLSFRQLSPTSTAQDPPDVFFGGTFEVIKSRWADSKDSLGMQNILLNLVCDLIIPGRGVFSNFPYPVYLTDRLCQLIDDMLGGSTGSHIRDFLQEFEVDLPRKRMDMPLRRKALMAITRRQNTALS